MTVNIGKKSSVLVGSKRRCQFTTGRALVRDFSMLFITAGSPF